VAGEEKVETAALLRMYVCTDSKIRDSHSPYRRPFWGRGVMASRNRAKNGLCDFISVIIVCKFTINSSKRNTFSLRNK
jgi:hypothetical protein